MENPFWDYSLAHYSRNGVDGICLQLQDQCNLDVNLLLYGAWMASNGRVLTVEHLEATVAAMAQWRGEVVQPLRALRRRLKSVSGAQEVFDQIGQLELQAERQQQALAYACYEAAVLPQDVGAPLSANLHLVAAQTGSSEHLWRPLIDQLEAALTV